MSRPLRVGSYNLNAQATPEQLDMLAARDLDILFLQECKWWDRDYSRTWHAAERRLRMRLFLSLSAHHGAHLAIGVREPLHVIEQRHETTTPWWHTVAHLVIDIGQPDPLHVVGTHLAPSSPEIRFTEVQALTVMKGRIIAGGDFNAAPADHPGNGEHDPRGKLDRRPAQWLDTAGWIDIGAHTGDPTPTVDGPPAYRCDRLYLARVPADAINSYSVGDARGSDHRPVFASITL